MPARRIKRRWPRKPFVIRTLPLRSNLAIALCDATVQAYGTPRQGADGPLTEDVMKCPLKPMRREDYSVTFTDAQWSELRQAFPGGVCDYTKPGVSQHGAVSWLTYQDKNGNVIYGGTPLGPPPVSQRIR